MIVYQKIEYLLSIVKSLIYCLLIFKFKEAIRLPILFHFKTKINVDRGSVICLGKRIIYGFGGTYGVSKNKQSFFIVRNGLLIFEGDAVFEQSPSIRVSNTLTTAKENKAICKIGNGFRANKNFYLYITTNCTIGENVLIGDGVKFRDFDGHIIYGNDMALPIKIGVHCWLASDVVILKGVTLGDDCVVSTRSIVTHSICKENICSHSLIGGIPAKVIRNGVYWER